MLVTCILHVYQYYMKEFGEFNLDVIFESDKSLIFVPIIWAFAYLSCHTTYLLMKYLEVAYLEWEPLPKNPINN